MNAVSIFLNRELGWLKFNQRVLHQAQDARTPLLERVRFLQIYQSNLDEFFMKRVGSLQRQHFAQITPLSLDGQTPEEQLKMIRKSVLESQEQIHHLLIDDLIPALKKENIRLLPINELTDDEVTWTNQFFRDKIFPILTPMAVDPGHPFPLISNLSVSLAVSLQAPSEEDLLFARIKIPDVFPMWIRLPTSDEKTERMVSLAEIIAQHLQDLFPGMTIQNWMSFRVTRNIDIDSDKEGAEDLLELIEEEVRQRRFAEVVRLEHGPHPDRWLLDFLTDTLELTDDDIFESPLNLEFKSLQAVFNINRPTMKYKPWLPVTPAHLLDESQPIFNHIRNSDVLVHQPYENFTTSVERFIVTAANDPQVVAIKMTLYRTSQESPIVNALIRAAEKGKQVVCLVELQARLDEERNIYWAHAMEKAGVHVVYGIVGLKTHAKLALVIRKERDDFKAYCNISTGNYHPQTAKLYTDFSLLTAKPEITNEVIEIFHYLTGRSLKSNYSQLLVSPINMKSRFLDLLKQEQDNAKKNLPHGVIIKCNNVDDKAMIEALYEASKAGVNIHMIVRGFCCLKPKVAKLSTNISVQSIIGPFLEHSRLFYFRNGAENPADGLFFIGSADWMSRNLHGRVEVATPVLDRANREKIWEALEIMMNDQRLSWDMNSEGEYRLRQPKKPEQQFGCHEILSEKAKLKSLQGRTEQP